MALLHSPTLTELRTVLGEDLHGLLHLFAGTLPSQVHDLREAHRHDDAARLKRCAHSLKGSSISVGAQDLAALAAEIERLAGGPERDRLDTALLALPAVSEQTVEALREGGWLRST